MTAAAAAKRTSVIFILAIVVFVKLEVCSEVQIPSEWFEWNLGNTKDLIIHDLHVYIASVHHQAILAKTHSQARATSWRRHRGTQDAAILLSRPFNWPA
jgi:hypothetical protein